MLWLLVHAETYTIQTNKLMLRDWDSEQPLTAYCTCFLSERVITISEANYQNNDPITEDKYIISPISVK